MNRSWWSALAAASILAATEAAEYTVPIVGYNASGWRYAIVGWGGASGFESVSYLDAGWSVGNGPFGDGGCGLPANSAWWINTDLVLRRWIELPASARVRVAAKIDNDVQAFVDGAAISNQGVFEGCGGSERYAALSPELSRGPTLVAIRARDRGGVCHFDARIELVFETDCDGDGVADYAQILQGESPDANGNGIPDHCECPADLDRDGAVGGEDLAAVLFAWGATGAKAGPADLDRDGTVGANDLSVLIAAWGSCP